MTQFQNGPTLSGSLYNGETNANCLNINPSIDYQLTITTFTKPSNNNPISVKISNLFEIYLEIYLFYLIKIPYRPFKFNQR